MFSNYIMESVEAKYLSVKDKIKSLRDEISDYRDVLNKTANILLNVNDEYEFLEHKPQSCSLNYVILMDN